MSVRLLSFLLCLGLAFAAAAHAAPALSYSTYLRDSFTPTAMATDPAGNIYLAGNAIVDPFTFQTTVLVIKLNPQASQYLYVRYVGGSTNESASAIAVDSAGDAYVAGVTISPDFPVTSGGNLGSAPVPGSTERSFVFKLDPNGQLVFSDLLGGSTNSFAQAVAVNASGQVLVSGTSVASGFPSTPGVYSVADTNGGPYLLELDPTGRKLLFSATGIGGTSITFDASGNIYMAGTTGSLTYPTTPGTYQPTFPVFQTCAGICQTASQGPNQYVTKLDPTGQTMIFSTSVSGTGNTMNNGLAVDAAGNVYLTGLAGAGYPFTVTPPVAPVGPAISALATPALPFLSKLDPTGQKLLFSVPVGGAGVQVDSNGLAYVGGILGLFDLYDVAANLPALAGLPNECLLLPESISEFRGKSAYVSQVDASSGNLLGSQFIGGSTLVIAGVAVSSNGLWIAGATNLPNFPYSPNALMSLYIGPNPESGAYLGAVDFSASQPPAGTPQIGCVVDAADLAPAGPIAPYQLLTIFGNGLGPATPMSATNNSTTTLGGVSVTFGTLQAPLLYVSSNQINLAVPLVTYQSTPPIQVTVNGVSSSPPLAFPVTNANPSLFVDAQETYEAISQGYVALALNQDGSVNSPTNPADLGSVVSIFVNGLAANPDLATPPLELYAGNGWSVINYSQTNPFVLQVALQVPSLASIYLCQANVCTATFEVDDLSTFSSSLLPGGSVGLKLDGEVYIKQGQ
jgi:uncharacterized protein (TIGR03437 family)